MSGRGGEASQFRNSRAVAQEFGNCSEKKKRERNELPHSSNGLPPPASKPAGIGRGCGHSPRGATNNAGQGWLLWHHTPPFSSESGEGLAARGRNGQWGERGREEGGQQQKRPRSLRRRRRGGREHLLFICCFTSPSVEPPKRGGGNELGEEEKGISPYPAPAGGEGGRGSKVCLLA